MYAFNKCDVNTFQSFLVSVLLFYPQVLRVHM